MVKVDGRVAIWIPQECHLNVTAAVDILRSLWVVVVPLTGAREIDAAVAPVEISHVNVAVGDTAELIETTCRGQATVIEAEGACVGLMNVVSLSDGRVVRQRMFYHGWKEGSCESRGHGPDGRHFERVADDILSSKR